MSIAIRRVVEGHCECGLVHTTGTYQPTCRHVLVCDLGEITNYHQSRHGHVDVGPLVMFAADWIHKCITDGPQKVQGITTSVDVRAAGDEPLDENSHLRLFVTVNAHNGCWTWELHDSHWADWHDGIKVYLGQWRD